MDVVRYYMLNTSMKRQWVSCGQFEPYGYVEYGQAYRFTLQIRNNNSAQWIYLVLFLYTDIVLCNKTCKTEKYCLFHL